MITRRKRQNEIYHEMLFFQSQSSPSLTAVFSTCFFIELNFLKQNHSQVSVLLGNVWQRTNRFVFFQFLFTFSPVSSSSWSPPPPHSIKQSPSQEFLTIHKHFIRKKMKWNFKKESKTSRRQIDKQISCRLSNRIKINVLYVFQFHLWVPERSV